MRRIITLILLALMMCVTTGDAQAAKFRKAIFYHHSVGGCFYNRQLLYDSSTPSSTKTVPKEIALYNTAKGYSGVNLVSMAESTSLPADGDNQWSTWASFFVGGHSGMDLTYPIVIIKTCYISQQTMTSSSDIAAYKTSYRTIVREMEKHPTTFFVIWNNMPAPTDGNSDRAVWSATFSVWCKDVLAKGLDSYGVFPRNVYVFDVFRKLADPVTGYCDPSYGDPGDDHPSSKSVNLVTPQFVNEVFDAAIWYEQHPLPITFNNDAFKVTIGTNNIGAKIDWQTISEINNYGFWVEKQVGGVFDTLAGSFRGGNNDGTAHNYTFTDVTARGTVTYRIRQIDLDGTLWFSDSRTIMTTEVADNVVQPETYALGQNYPNPFNPTTTITYRLMRNEYARIVVRDLLGKVIYETPYVRQTKGEHSVVVDGAKLSSGTYIYTLQTESFMLNRKMLLVK